MINGVNESGRLRLSIDMWYTPQIRDPPAALDRFVSGLQFHKRHSGERPYPLPLSGVGTRGAG